MSKNWNKQRIVTFVKETLGCACPDEVFKKIDCQQEAEIVADSLVLRLVIGDTLLVYIFLTQNIQEQIENMATLVSTGKQDRDNHTFNRYRLVLIDSEVRGENETLIKLFEQCTKNDEKLHLHFVEQQMVDDLKEN